MKKIKREENIIRELSQLPPGLSDIYAKIYGEMSKTDTFEIAVKALRFLLCSQKPISTGDFLTAVSPPSEKAIDSESLLDYCSDLIVEDKALGTFRLAHLSVREYLEEKCKDYTPADTHAVAAEICLSCITKTKGRVRSNMAAPEDEVSSSSLLDYAMLFWPLHCGLSEGKRAVPPLEPPISSFIMQRRVSNRFSKWMEDTRTLVKSLSMEDPLRKKLLQCFCSPANPFFLSCAFGLYEAVEHSSVPATDRSESGQGGLHLASLYGHERVVKALLGKGVPADSRDTYGRTPLFYAIKNGHLNVVQLLLNQGNEVEISNEVLWLAAQNGKAALEMCLNRDGEIEISEGVIGAAVSKYS